MLQRSKTCNMTDSHPFLKEQTMPNTSKSSKKTSPVAGTAAADFFETITPMCVGSVERVADLQKKCIDAAAEQTADWIGAWRNAFSFFPVAPPAFFFGVANQAVQTWAETQKSAIDLTVEQTQAIIEINKTRAEAYSKVAQQVTASVQTTVKRSIEAQKKALEFAAAQNKTVCQAVKKQIGSGPATTIIDSYERGAEALIEAQKSILDATTKPFVAAEV
jgi:uncharacterized protein YdbL (DUF1318 family)